MRLGLTGSIGMGKSTTAAMFRARGVPVWDADGAVHALYGPDAEGTRAIAGLAPETVGPAGVDRARLRDAIRADPCLLPRVEAAIHPLVRADRLRFQDAAGPITLADIPLLFETGAEGEFDRVVVVTAPADVQRARVLERPGMTEAALDAILARQMPDAEKRARADYVIDTSDGLEAAKAQVDRILREVGHA